MQRVCQTVWLLQDTVYLIEAKRQNMFWDTHYIPEAVSQAIALLVSGKYASLVSSLLDSGFLRELPFRVRLPMVRF